MIRFEPAPKPDGFAERVEARGKAWLAANSDGRPRDYWSEFKPKLADAFRSLCAYSAMYEPVGTVDHFVSCDEDRTRAYDWSNYRFASGWLNSSKQALRSHEVVDPFAMEDGWFELLLPSLRHDCVANDARRRDQVAAGGRLVRRVPDVLSPTTTKNAPATTKNAPATTRNATTSARHLVSCARAR